MKKLAALTAAILLGGTAMASATDLTGRASVKDGASTATGWTGPYIGAQGGYSITNHDVSLDVPGGNLFNLDGLSGHGGTVGVVIGYDHLVLPQLLIGAYGEYNFTNSETTLNALHGAFDGRVSQGDMYVFGGRIGTFVRGTLVYVNAGYAHTDFTAAGSYNTVSLGSLTKNADGALVGGGVEVPLGAGLFVTAKYDHTFFNDITWGKNNTYSLVDAADLDRVQVGVSWKIGR